MSLLSPTMVLQFLYIDGICQRSPPKSALPGIHLPRRVPVVFLASVALGPDGPGGEPSCRMLSAGASNPPVPRHM
jgi:hypothetical protein